VYCVHCAQAHDYGADDEVTCMHCGVRLAVRGHFSERLGAWLGVCADADHPYAEVRA
jgi:DNA-directed RNA polymerase subunit RPC12/RpoP